MRYEETVKITRISTCDIWSCMWLMEISLPDLQPLLADKTQSVWLLSSLYVPSPGEMDEGYIIYAYTMKQKDV